ncbi:MAG: type II toxin-antitoxin system RelE/ParE family toxin [Deltaproteobacteria bacterium]|nr:type II toxin-antitoxin system RelE/ParE family toxin [Deltaproteobacteria bacterium]
MKIERAFEDSYRITWFLYVEDETKTCKVRNYLDKRPPEARNKLIARMKQFAEQGDWNTRVGFIKRLDLPDYLADVTIYEVKVKHSQDRLLFIRHRDDAIALDAMQKQDDWSKKDHRVLEKTVKTARGIFSRYHGGNKR